ncbi:helix-turn-helix domain-containing protein [Wenzhouxiangella sp. AB-CW3]|uniref:helix-turn-helix domain-containing protein n=1 Tax=Wenzhouxiangella sp. AB-CW3 TaxID=2771012 RepID=UPI00168B2E2C|nr:helix-turn-helix domain-containing protein [Wenzhouxiangella sp. AB-CW3]QOC22213.1 helix-turn-helix domain-containing protein [Wenzhouxiangella sp. AB-CW3]
MSIKPSPEIGESTGNVLKWSTLHSDPADCPLNQWQRRLSELILPIRARVENPGDRAGFRASFRLGEFGDGAFLAVSGMAQWLEREAGEISSSPGQWLFASTMVSGHGWLHANGTRLRIDEGQTSFVDSTQPFSLEFDQEFEFVSAMLPRADLLDLKALTPLAHGTQVPPPGGAALHGFLAALTDDDSTDPSRLYDQFIGLVISAIEPTGPGSDSDRLLPRIHAFLLHSLSRPDLNTSVVANRFGLSIRQVQRLFQAQGTTVPLWIREQRLRCCARDLVSPDLQESSIGDIALRHGFTDMSYFTRSFNEHYGTTPGTWRARHSKPTNGSSKRSRNSPSSTRNT